MRYIKVKYREASRYDTSIGTYLRYEDGSKVEVNRSGSSTFPGDPYYGIPQYTESIEIESQDPIEGECDGILETSSWGCNSSESWKSLSDVLVKDWIMNIPEWPTIAEAIQSEE